jgi:hypothetical protein
VTRPEEALARARQELAAMRAAGSYREAVTRHPIEATAAVTTAKLYEWALIEPDVRDVRSTRRTGAPITALKRLLLRLLGQYHGALIAEQTRFNVNLLVALSRLEDRIAELERRLGDSERPR